MPAGRGALEDELEEELEDELEGELDVELEVEMEADDATRGRLAAGMGGIRARRC